MMITLRRWVLTKKKFDPETKTVLKEELLDFMDEEEVNKNTPNFISYNEGLSQTLFLKNGASVSEDSSTFEKQGAFQFTVPGVIFIWESNVIRTDGIITEALLGQGEALDSYGQNLQSQDIAWRQAKNKKCQSSFTSFAESSRRPRRHYEGAADRCTGFLELI